MRVKQIHVQWQSKALSTNEGQLQSQIKSTWHNCDSKGDSSYNKFAIKVLTPTRPCWSMAYCPSLRLMKQVSCCVNGDTGVSQMTIKVAARVTFGHGPRPSPGVH